MDDFCDSSFWNSTQTWEGSWPHFTSCFQNTVLMWSPCAFLWLAAIFYVYSLPKYYRSQPLPISRIFLGKMMLCGLLFVTTIIQFLIHVSERSRNKESLLKADVFAPAALAITILLAGIIILLERQKAFITSGVLFVFWFFLGTAQIVPFYTLLQLQVYKRSILKFSLFYVQHAFILFQVIIHCFAERPHQPYQPINKPCPETKSSFLSRLTFWWANGLLVQGFRMPLTEENMTDLNPRDMSSTVVPKFLSKWNRELAYSRLRFRAKQHEKDKRRSSFYRGTESVNSDLDENTPLIAAGNKNETKTSKAKKPEHPDASLLKILFKTFGLELLQSQMWKLFYDALILANPLVLGQLIQFIEAPDSESWHGYVLALVLFLSMQLQSLFFQQLWHQSTSLGLRIRTTIISTVFRKALTMNNQARQESTVGEIVNLMSVDAEHIEGTVGYLYSIWSSPLQICVCLYLLYTTLGLPMFAGLGLLILLIPINGLVMSRLESLMTQLMAQKDQRMKLINEVLNGIKILKLYAWELPFSKQIGVVRDKELRVLWSYTMWSAGMTFSWTVAPYAVSLVTFITYIYTVDDHYLNPQTAFVAIALFNVLRFAINFAPMIITDVIKALVSIRRLNHFLSHDDLDSKSTLHDPDSACAVSICNGTFMWNPELGPVLKNISVDIPVGSLVAVVGQVGSGKSSLVSAMIGDMEKVEGQVMVKGSVAYIPQQAWIQNDTVRNNILFGLTMVQDVYDSCIAACALTHDLSILPAGDLTEIGERGINLSGGQKQRVSLARAVYNDSDIYLLDDPLSAVDSHVGKHIFEEVIGRDGLLKNKTRVLVTHGVHWLPLVDKVFVMKDGSVSEAGTYEELLSHDGPFAQFLKTYFLQADNTEEEDDPEVQEMRRKVFEKLENATDTEAEDDADVKRERRKSSSGEGKLGKDEKDTKTTEAGNDKQGTDKLIEEEKVAVGRVRFDIFREYARSLGYGFSLAIVVTYILYEASAVLSNIWLSQWTDDQLLNNFTAFPTNSSDRMDRNNYYLILYGSLGAGQFLFVAVYSVIESFRTVHASRVIHEKMLSRILHAPMVFFDTTPVGRIVNRFSKDIDTIDTELPLTFLMTLDTACVVLSTLIIISYSTPYFLVAVVPLTALYIFIQRFYVATSRQLKRLESKTRSPVYTLFSETLSGASVIRAFGKQTRFIEESQRRVDLNQNFKFYSYTANRWLGFRLEFLGNIVVLCAATIAVAMKDTVSGGIVGLSVSYALEITTNLNWLVRMISDLETQVVSVERVKEYSEIAIEAPWSIPSQRPPLSWPHHGQVKVAGLSVRYRPELDLVLKDISFSIQAGEKVGIVGRTGAGKSSLTLSLFRLLEPAQGQINVDNVNIAKLGLHDLRTKLTILPQDPVIFAGSLRMNLDPFDEYSDVQVWAALEHAHLNSFVTSLPDQLQHECGEGGENLSVGQRQLLCLARSLLRKTKILILDEATAAVDMETDDLIQQTIRTEFSDCTVLTIAHRLNTVLDYDKILVLDKGQIAEFDAPENLLKNRDSIFYQMASSAGLVS